MADRLAGGKLKEIVLAMRDDGVTLTEMADRLDDEYGIEVTRQTLSGWLRVYEAQRAAADAEGVAS